MKRYRTIGELVAAMRADEIPCNVVSPGGAARSLGITRQALHQRVKRGTLAAWTAEGVVLIDASGVRAEVRKKRRIAESQGELDVAT